jgi:CheY-like chemotaxis protein
MPTRILAVDDDVAVLEVLQLMLEELNCEVLALSDSRQAADRVKHQEFDCIFMDSRMPYLSGLDLARLIRDSGVNGSVPIVMLTGSQDSRGRIPEAQGPVTFFVGKPFDMPTLERVLVDIAASPVGAHSTPVGCERDSSR